MDDYPRNELEIEVIKGSYYKTTVTNWESTVTNGDNTPLRV